MSAGGAPPTVCEVCGRFYRSWRHLRPFVCGPACARVYHEGVTGLVRALVVVQLTERAGSSAVLCLTPVPGKELAERRAALPYLRRGGGDGAR